MGHYEEQYEMFDKELAKDKQSALDKQVGGTHYKTRAIQPIEYIQKNNLSYMEGCIIKYITRHKDKNGAEDIKKIIQYCELILEMEYGE